MFDIGFWELVTIAIIGIVVVGPDRLPEVVRTVASYVRKARRAFNSVKSDIERELDLDEIRRQMADVDMEDHIKKLNQSVMDMGNEVGEVASRLDADIRHQLDVDDPEVRASEKVHEHNAGQNGEQHTSPHQADSSIEHRGAHDIQPTHPDEYADTGVEGEPKQSIESKGSITQSPSSKPSPTIHD